MNKKMGRFEFCWLQLRLALASMCMVLYTVILVGHPTEFDDLGQLSGRAGWDAFMKGDEWSSITVFHQEATLIL